MRAHEFLIEAEPATTTSADDIRAAIATGVSQAQRDRYDRIPSTILPPWMHGLKGALTGDFSGKKDDAMAISKVVQDLKKDQPQDYGFPAWTNQRYIDTAKKLLTGQIAPPDLTPTQQDQYKEKVKKTSQDQQQQQPPKPTPVQPTPKPVQQQQQQPVKKTTKSDLPSSLAPLSKVNPGATMTIGNKKITFDGKVWTDQAGQKYGGNPTSLAQLNKSYLEYENARRATEVLKIQAKASQNRGNN